MYGSEAWTISNTMKKRLDALEMWFLRRMLRVSWRDHVTNDEVLRRAQTNRTLLRTIRARQMKFLGHVIRENGLEKICLQGMVDGKRARGRQRVKYLDSLTQDITGNKKPHELMRDAEDRARWRSMVAHVQDMAPR